MSSPPGFLAGLRRIDAQIRGTKKRLTVPARASGTTLTSLSGAGPLIAATVIGAARPASRVASRDHFAAGNATAPIQGPSGRRKIYRLSRRGKRRLNHAIHMAAVTQASQRHSDSRAHYARQLAEGKTPKKAPRSRKRRVSGAVFAPLQAGARRAAAGPR
jgi:transposase